MLEREYAWESMFTHFWNTSKNNKIQYQSSGGGLEKSVHLWNSQKHLWWVLLLKKLQAFRLLLKRDSGTGTVLMNFDKFLRTTFL